METNEFHTVRGYQLLQQNKNLLTSAMEDYLEMIYRNSETEDYLRVNQLAEFLNVKASSATKMVQKLGSIGLLKYKKYGIVILTDDGKEIGRYLLKRHRIIEEFLKFIGADKDVLTETELIEHYISSYTLDNISRLNQFFETHSEIYKTFQSFKLN